MERKSITQYEKICQSVCRRRQCPIEQGNLLEIDRGNQVSTKALKHRLGLCKYHTSNAVRIQLKLYERMATGKELDERIQYENWDTKWTTISGSKSRT